MGMSNSCCSACSYCNEEKLFQSIHSDTEKPLIDLSQPEIQEKLNLARNLFQVHLESLAPFASESIKIQIQESTKGHLILLTFPIPCSPSSFSNFLDSHDRKTWDNLIEFSKLIEKTESYSVSHLKYKSQLSYSAKELVFACCKEVTEGKVVSVFTSIPCDHIAKIDQVEVFEGGYEAVSSSANEVRFLVHLNVGSKSLSALFQKITERIIADMTNRLVNLLNEELR